MSTFAPEAIRTVTPDPFKHVNYTLGMILGVDELNQDFAFLEGRDEWQTRGVLGYGTFCGLQVLPRRAGSEGWEVLVNAGAAIDPRGQMIRVPQAQCARLRPWLDAHRDEVRQRVGAPPDFARLYVVLCYRQCPVDLVPIPGEPCRTEEDARAPSRLQDDFQLELAWDPPEQRQESAVRDFVAWLHLVPVEDFADSAANLAAFEAAVRGAVPELLSPPVEPPLSPLDYMYGSPPAGLRIPRMAVDVYLRRSFLIWTTELRPLWLGIHESCSGDLPREDCVLLGELHVPLTAAGELADSAEITLHEEQRPYLLSLRMVQEWMLRRMESEALGSPLSGPVALAGDAQGPESNNLVAGLQGLPLLPPGAGDAGRFLQFSGTQWQLADPPAAGGPVALAGDATGSAAATTVVGLQTRPVNNAAPAEGEFLRFTGGEWRPASPDPALGVTLAGDATGDAGANAVVGLQTRPVNNTAPAEGEFLRFTGGEWRPATPDPVPPVMLGGDAQGAPAANTVAGISGRPVVAPGAGDAGRFLQFTGADWRLGSPPGGGGQSFVVAAGRLDRTGTPLYNFGKLEARVVTFSGASYYFVRFDNIDPGARYVFKALVANTIKGAPRTVEYIDLRDDPTIAELKNVVDQFNNANPGNQINFDRDLPLRVSPAVDVNVRGLMIEVSLF